MSSSLTLRSPVIAVIGSVNTGKTTFIKNISGKEVNEVGGITQNLTPFLITKNQLLKLTGTNDSKINISSMFIIDTPGHAPFSHMRETAMKVTDFAIVLVDIFDGIKELTTHAISFLVEHKKPFLIAVNKIDQINGWKSTTQSRIKNALAEQSKEVKLLYEVMLSKINQQLLAGFGLESELYYRNSDPRRCISIVPLFKIC